MSAYDSLDFQPMLMDELFIQHRGKVGIRSENGRIPYVVAASRNNSHVGFVSEDALFPGKWLSIVNTGAGGVGYCTYQPVPFWASNNVTALEPRFKDATDKALIALAGCVRLQTFGKFTFGNIANVKRLKKTRIMVPVTTDSNGEQVVDWDGLDRLGAELLEQVTAQTRNVIETDPGESDTLPDLRFEPMLITDLFELHNGSLTSTDDVGDIPYVTASFRNNGVVAYVKQAKFPGGWLSFVKTGDGGAGTCFYQPAPFWPSSSVFALEPKSDEVTSDSLILLASIITHQCFSKYSRGNSANKHRLSRQQIMVPVTTDANGDTVPDWEGMAQYGRALRVRVERDLAPVLG